MTELTGGELCMPQRPHKNIGTQNVDLEPFGKPPDLHPNIDRLEEEEDRNS